MQGRIVQVSISRGGLPKYAVAEAEVAPLGLEGDLHSNPAIHGGPLKAVLIVCAEAISELVALGYPVFAGALGENLTVEGLDRRLLRAGQRYRVNEVWLELTKPRGPCANLDVYGAGIQKDVFDSRVKAGDPSSPLWGRSGFYAAVIRTGRIRTHDIITLVDEAA